MGVAKTQNHTTLRRDLRPLFFVLLGSFLWALLLGSGTTLATVGYEEKDLPFSSAFGEGISQSQDGSLQVHAGHYNALTYYNLTDPARTLEVSTGAYHEETVSVTATLYLLSYGSDGGERLTQIDQAVLGPAGLNHSAVLMLRQEDASAQKPYDIRLIFTDAEEDFSLDGVTLNKSGFSFNFGQFFLFSVLGVCIWGLYKSGFYRRVFSRTDPYHRALLWLDAGVCVLVVLVLVQLVMAPGQGLFFPYDPANPDPLLYSDQYHTQYYHLFDALLHGQLAMRTPPDPQLLALANPYDPVQREGIYALWDMVLHNGKYYCYYGPAPMPLYFACYFLFGVVPSAAFACMVPAVVAVVGLCGALQELLRYFQLKVNLLLLLFCLPALCCGSLLFMLVSCADSYEQPYLWAMAALACFLWLFFLAIRWEKPLVRRLFYLLAGGCVVFVAASRPAVVLTCLVFALPVAIKLIRGKKDHLGSLVLDAVFLFLPVLIGAALLMAYNQLRFGSVFDFGNTMQLTVWDMTTQNFRISPVWLVQALWLFCFNPLQILPRFPFVFVGDSMQYNYGSFFYNYGLFGLVNLPLYWSFAGIAKTIRNAPVVQKVVYLAVPLSSALLLWYTYCIGNLVYRYICDVTVGLGLLAALILLELVSCRPPGQKRFLYITSILMCAFTILVGLLLCFQNERMFILSNSPDFYITVSRLLQLG